MLLRYITLLLRLTLTLTAKADGFKLLHEPACYTRVVLPVYKQVRSLGNESDPVQVGHISFILQLMYEF